MTGTLYANPAPLTATPTALSGENCDRCNLPNAVIAVTLPSGAQLHFCGHHFRQHESALHS